METVFRPDNHLNSNYHSIGSIGNDGNGRDNVTQKVICAVSNFITLIPTLLIVEMLTIFSGENVKKIRKFHFVVVQ